MKAPFPWFGGKRRVADLVWQELGDVDNYIEPFAGSLAVLLERPHMGDRTETVNDADALLANFWRALAADPEQVAHYADWPVNESDLFARHLWLVEHKDECHRHIEADPDYYDAKVAGWWVWGINSWIGSGWCAGNGPWVHGDNGEVRQLPHLGNPGQGVNRQRPHLGNPGKGTNSPGDFSGGGSGCPANKWQIETRSGNVMRDYMLALSSRLRRVRVCCGDWSRVVTDGAMAYGATVGIFLDPPYLGDVRTHDLYATDDHNIANEVRKWAVARGDDPRMRIVLAGYEPEHIGKIPSSWRMHSYSGTLSYGTHGGEGSDNRTNRHLERLWLSPHCLGAKQMRLFG